MAKATPLFRRGQKGSSELHKSKPLFCLSSLIRLESKNNFLGEHTPESEEGKHESRVYYWAMEHLNKTTGAGLEPRC